MFYYLISALVVFLACTVGATVGFGGGVIIKPILDAMNFCTVDIVNFVSSCAVFAMSISSTARHIKAKTKFDKKIALCVSFGAVAGGIIGNRIFNLVVNQVDNQVVKMLQGILIMAFVGFGVYYVNKKNPKTFHFTNPVMMFLTGLILGTLNSFLGIGGGPINITMLLLMFSLAVKDGAVYSICIVFFCQLSNLVTLFATNQFVPYKDFAPLVILGMVAAVIGGLLGSKLNKKLSDKTIRIVFSCVMLFVFGINLFNVVKGII